MRVREHERDDPSGISSATEASDTAWLRTVAAGGVEFRRFYDAVACGVLVRDAGGVIVDANAAAERIVGRSRAELCGRTWAGALLDARREDGSPLPEAERPVAVALRTRQPVRDFTLSITRPDGEQRWLVLDTVPLCATDGTVQQIISSFVDVTERRRAEEERERMFGRERLALEHLSLLARASEILVSSLDYETTLHNVVGLTMPALADFGFFDVVEPDETVRRIARAHADPRRQAILEQSQWARSTHPFLNLCALSSGQPALHPDIDDAWYQQVAQSPEHLAVLRELAFCSMLTVPLVYQERLLGALTLFYADSGRHHTGADLALAQELARRAATAVENARLFKDLQSAVQARDEFLSIASHELRTPLTGLKGNTQLLLHMHEHGRLEPERLAQALRRIDTTTNRLAALVADLLDVSRIRTGRLDLTVGPIDLSALIRVVVSPYQEQLADRHTLRVEVPQGPCVVHADAARLEQVLINLVDNAVKYSPGGGVVRVTLQVDDVAVAVRVQDSGIGLPADAIEAIFEPFGRAPNAAEQHIPGLGLGLYICRNIVERHGGRIWAESPGPGQGTTFCFTLPYRDASAA